MGYKEAQTYAARFQKAPVKTPDTKVPDGPLCGNGDIGIAAAADPAAGILDFYIGKNDIWNARSSGEIPGMRGYGGLRFSAGTPGEYSAIQRIDRAETELSLIGPKTEWRVSCAALRETNYIVHRVEAVRGDVQIEVEFFHTHRDEEAGIEKSGGEIRAWKEYANAECDWPCKAESLTRVLGHDSLHLTLHEKESVTVVTVLHTNQETEHTAELCGEEMAALTEEKLSSLQAVHEVWWKHFWQESSILIPEEPLLVRCWYHSHYLMACCCEKGKYAPGLFGNWNTTDFPAWGGDYHLNYNYEAPWWGLYSSNHMEITEPYDRPLLEYMPKAKKAAREKLGCRGLYMLVGIGPKGLRTAALTDKDGNDDVNYWGQKSNAAYAAVNMVMRFYCTYDRDYALETAYPYLEEAARFWLDYLEWDGERYVVCNDCVHENAAAARGVFDWADENTPDDGGHCNPIITLGLLRMLFGGLLDICREYGLHPEEYSQWEHVLNCLSSFPTMEKNGRKIFRLTEQGTDWSNNNSLAIQHIFPAGCIGLDSEKELLQTARNTFEEMDRWDDYNAFPTYFAAGARIGTEPELLLDHLKEQILRHGMKNGFLFFGGGGIECCSTVPMVLNEMLMQSHEGVIRFFPVWNQDKDASFQKLRAYGAFLVSASLQDGDIGEAEIYSEKGRPCTVEFPYNCRVTAAEESGKTVGCYEKGRFTFPTEAGKRYRLEKEQ